MNRLGVAVRDLSESTRLGEPETERLDAPAGEADTECHGADNSVSSRGTVRAVFRRGDGDEAEVTEETDGLRSNQQLVV